MKIQNISDVNTFFKVIDSCKGTVELVSPEGDRINLKSKLSPVSVDGKYFFQWLYQGTGPGST